MAVQGSKQLYRVVVHPFLVRHETEIDETLQNIGERGKKVLGKVTQHGINLAATTVVTSAIKVCLSLSSLHSLPPHPTSSYRVRQSLRRLCCRTRELSRNSRNSRWMVGRLHGLTPRRTRDRITRLPPPPPPTTLRSMKSLGE